jgi:PTS system ascorbate-specific IIB component
MKKLRIMVVCGFGLGSSMVLKLTLDGVLKEAGLQAETFCSDENTCRGETYDIVFTSQPLVHLFQGKKQPTIVINNFLSKDEVRNKGLDLIRNLAQS